MARKVIVLDRLDRNAPRYKVAFWCDVPAGRQSLVGVAQAGATSAVKDITGTELTDFQAGKFVEFVDDISFPAGASLANIQAGLQARQAAYQAQVTADKSYDRYGSFWDGTAWTLKSNP